MIAAVGEEVADGLGERAVSALASAAARRCCASPYAVKSPAFNAAWPSAYACCAAAMSWARSVGTVGALADAEGLDDPDGDGLVDPGGALLVGPVPVEPELDDPGGAPTRLAIAAE